MLISDLKNAILNKTLSDDVLLFKWTDNAFLCHEYVRKIAEVFNKTIVQIESIKEVNNDSLFTADTLYVLYTDKFKDKVNGLKNIIVVSKSIESDIDYIEFPKLENWQIEDLVKVCLTGLTDDSVQWLCRTCNYNIYRIKQEINKLKLFLPQQQELMLKKLIDEGNFNDLSSLNIFNLITAIIKKDYATVQTILANMDIIDIEGTGVVTLLLREFKKIIDIQTNKHATADSMGITPKQFAAIKYNCGKYTTESLVNIYEFLTSIDQNLKQGKLSFHPDSKRQNVALTKYVIYEILGGN